MTMRCSRIAGVVMLLSVAACDELLQVSNPGTLQEEELSSPQLEQFLINGVIGEFQFAYGTYVYWSGVLADEVFTDHSNFNFREFSRHDFTDINTANEMTYGALQRARQSADDATERVKEMLGARAAASLNVARALIYGGYSYVLLGEGFCEAPVNLSAPLSSDQLLAHAIARFEEGITVATVARAGADSVAASSLIHLAHVGAARAALKRGDLAGARNHAALVPDSFERWAYYSTNTTRENNPFPATVRQSLSSLAMHPVFHGLSDVRVPEPADSQRSQNSHAILPPRKPSSFSGWTGVGASQTIEPATHIRFASGLEARYIRTEVDEPNAAMLTFVNARRAVGGKPAVSLSGSSLLAEFRRQRAYDFYLTGQRLGDLRRYADSDTSMFPAGKFPTTADVYGNMHCFIVPRSEKSGNPHY